MKKNIIFVLIAVLIGAASFSFGISFSKGTSAQANLFQQGGQNFDPNRMQRQGAGMGQGGRTTGNFINGEIISKDDKSVTIRLRNGGSQFIFFAPSTQILKSTNGTAEDLANGVNIMASGTANPDGSVTAQMIQIRPAGEQLMNGRPGETQQTLQNGSSK